MSGIDRMARCCQGPHAESTGSARTPAGAAGGRARSLPAPEAGYRDTLGTNAGTVKQVRASSAPVQLVPFAKTPVWIVFARS